LAFYLNVLPRPKGVVSQKEEDTANNISDRFLSTKVDRLSNHKNYPFWNGIGCVEREVIGISERTANSEKDSMLYKRTDHLSDTV